jgi:hypothetical protein
MFFLFIHKINKKLAPTGRWGCWRGYDLKAELNCVLLFSAEIVLQGVLLDNYHTYLSILAEQLSAQGISLDFKDTLKPLNESNKLFSMPDSFN